MGIFFYFILTIVIANNILNIYGVLNKNMIVSYKKNSDLKSFIFAVILFVMDILSGFDSTLSIIVFSQLINTLFISLMIEREKRFETKK